MQEVDDDYFKDDDDEVVATTVPAGKVSLLRSSHDLEVLFKNLNKVSKKAVKRLVDGLSSGDEKVAIDCAKALLSFQMNISKEINTDQIQRVIAEYKYNRENNGLPKPVAEDLPIVDFTNIQEL